MYFCAFLGVGGCLGAATGTGEGLEGVCGMSSCLGAATGTREGLEDVPGIGGCLGAGTGAWDDLGPYKRSRKSLNQREGVN